MSAEFQCSGCGESLKVKEVTCGECSEKPKPLTSEPLSVHSFSYSTVDHYFEISLYSDAAKRAIELLERDGSFLLRVERAKPGEPLKALPTIDESGCEPTRRNLPRLSHLPDDLRAVAVEFLDLHGAWDTGFRAELCEYEGVEPMLFLKWGDVSKQDEETAFFSFFPAVLHNPIVNTWNLEAGGVRDLYAKQRSSGPLRRSHDFAEFVRRFAE